MIPRSFQPSMFNFFFWTVNFPRNLILHFICKTFQAIRVITTVFTILNQNRSKRVVQKIRIFAAPHCTSVDSLFHRLYWYSGVFLGRLVKDQNLPKTDPAFFWPLRPPKLQVPGNILLDRLKRDSLFNRGVKSTFNEGKFVCVMFKF